MGSIKIGKTTFLSQNLKGKKLEEAQKEFPRIDKRKVEQAWNIANKKPEKKD